MNSYRIIEVSKKLSVGDIYGSIITHSFDDSSGFFVNKKRRDIVKASHVYKKLITKNIKDIEGNQEVVSYFDYIETKFNIISSDDKSYIVIIDPPRESKVFNNDLKKALPLFTSFKYISKKPKDFYLNLVKSGYDVKVNEIELSNVNIRNKGLGRFAFSSDKDIYDEAMSFVNNKDYDIRYMILSIDDHLIKLKCKVNYTGMISMSDFNKEIFDVYLKCQP